MKELVTPKEIAEAIGTSTNNIYQAYRNNPKKQTFYEILQIGVFAKKHQINIKNLTRLTEVYMDIKNGDE